MEHLNFFIKAVREYKSAESGGSTREVVEEELQRRNEMENNYCIDEKDGWTGPEMMSKLQQRG